MLSGILDDERVRPLTVNGVQGLLLTLALLVENGAEGVLLAAQPTLARVVDLGNVTRAAGDAGCLLKLDERRTVDQGFDMQGGKSDEIFLLLGGIVLVGPGGSESQKSVADLLDLDGAREGCLLGVVSLELEDAD